MKNILKVDFNDSKDSFDCIFSKDELKRIDYKKYYDACEIASDRKAEFMIPNDDDIKAQITSSHILRLTNRKLLIYTGGFRRNIIEDRFDFFKNFKNALSNVPEIRIIVDEHYQSNVVKEILNYSKLRPENISLFVSKNNIQEYLIQVFQDQKRTDKFDDFRNIDDPEYHFLVSDDMRYRLEFDQKNKFAKVYFNDKANATSLARIFETLETTFSNKFEFA